VIVVDASVALQWIVPERDGQVEAESVLSHDPLVGPDLLLAEVANALRKKIAAEEVGRDHALRGLRTLAQTVQVIAVGPELIASAFELALAMRHPVYDCVYLALAGQMDGQLATRDRELINRARLQGLSHRLADLPLREDRPS
jgi:predicted nucleic acid-binding protein